MIIIDSDNYKASGIETLFFPGGEPHAKLPIFGQQVVLFLKARTWADVGFGVCVWDGLRRQHERLPLQGPVLFMPYSPGARQDRSDGTAPLTKAIIASMFATNHHLHVFDLHSDLYAYNWRPKNWMPEDLRLQDRPDVDFVIAPDKGAVNRARNFMNAYCPNATLVLADKHRDEASGKLSNYVLPKLEMGGTYLVVDDICDGGGTFNLLGDAFKQQAVSSYSRLELFVSHGIFSKGFSELRRRYDHIYTTDSFYEEDPLLPASAVTVYPLTPILERIANV